MRAALDAAMSGRWHQVFRFLCLVTKLFGYSTSKDKGQCGRDLFMLFIWLGGVCFCLSVCFDASVVIMVAQRWS